MLPVSQRHHPESLFDAGSVSKCRPNQRTMAHPTFLTDSTSVKFWDPWQSTDQDLEDAAFFIHNSEHPRGRIFHTVKPADIPIKPPIKVKRPTFPEMRRMSMQMLVPCIFFVQYPCIQRCRTMGICIHYQFVVGCRKCPDGLRCSICLQRNVEEVRGSVQHSHL